MDSLLKDVRQAVRTTGKSPTFAIAAVAMLAVGIGVNALVFSLTNGALFKGFPLVAGNDHILYISNNGKCCVSYPDFNDWRAQTTMFDDMALVHGLGITLSDGAGFPEDYTVTEVTSNTFGLVRQKPVLGRDFTPADELPGAPPVVILRYSFWERRFAKDPGVIGRSVRLNGVPTTVIGIMPRGFSFPQNQDLWVPLVPTPEVMRRDRRNTWFVFGRLSDGATIESARAEMDTIGQRLARAWPASNASLRPEVRTFEEFFIGENAALIYRAMVGAVGFVLLIACANLGNLMLGRTAARRKELAIRTALGAGRGRLVRQIVTESLVLAAFGSALGLMFAWWATRLFIRIGGDSIPRPDAVAIDGRVMVFTLTIAVVAALLAGIIPALQASRPAVVENLREGGREGGTSASRRTRHVLIAAEVALAFMLLAGAGLLLRTLWTMQNVDRGFSPSRIATMRLSLPGSAYAGPPEVRAFYSRLLERVRALPGVESAATGTGVLMPLLANSGIMTIEGRPPTPGPQIEYPREIVSPGYFETLGVTLVAGRTFTEQDHADATLVTVVNETFARDAWPGQEPLGRRVRFGGAQSKAPWLTVIGVVRDLRRSDDVRRAVRPEVYMCTLQNPPRSQMLLVRTATDPNAIVASVRREVQAINPQLPLFAVGTLEGQIFETLTTPRFRAVLLAGFAVIALLLATIGIYGVTAHAVGQRTHEVGIRMALGAARRDVLGLILVQHLKPALIGVAVGGVGAVILSQSLRTLVYGIRATDPITFIAMGAALIAVTIVACWIPARRATRVDPLVALRAE
jgi:putative ABC transport system permease protein